jgi:ubiquinone/menaquinone biosynthesis C-methylase UbiE
MAKAPAQRISSEHDDLIRQHYREVAQKHGESPRSSMEDDFVRQKELEWITTLVGAVGGQQGKPLRVLDLGCGNAYTLEQVARAHPRHKYFGVDFTEELLAIASGRKIKGAEFAQGDARSLQFRGGSFDLVYTERCLINILDGEEQARGLHEIARVLRRGGHYLMIECFTDGLANNNKARRECGLPEIPEAYHNKYIERERFLEAIRGKFAVLDAGQFQTPGGPELCSNFLSSYYFISRVLYPAVTKGEVVRNSEMAKFFSFLPPVGNYSPIQAFVLRRE